PSSSEPTNFPACVSRNRLPLSCVDRQDEWRTCSMTNYDPSNEPPRDPRVPPGAQPQPTANQTVVRSGGSSSLVIAAVVAAILIILFLGFGGGVMSSDGGDAVENNSDAALIPATMTPEPDAPTPDAAPAPPAPDTSPAAPAPDTPPA